MLLRRIAPACVEDTSARAISYDAADGGGRSAHKLLVPTLAEELRRGNEVPRLAVSIGVAVYPRDGEKPQALLGAADRVLYQVKARGAENVRQ